MGKLYLAFTPHPTCFFEAAHPLPQGERERNKSNPGFVYIMASRKNEITLTVYLTP